MRIVKDSQGREFAYTSILIPMDIHQKARDMRINMSQICSDALRDHVEAITNGS